MYRLLCLATVSVNGLNDQRFETLKSYYYYYYIASTISQGTAEGNSVMHESVLAVCVCVGGGGGGGGGMSIYTAFWVPTRLNYFQ